jgi:hypothetical protein
MMLDCGVKARINGGNTDVLCCGFAKSDDSTAFFTDSNEFWQQMLRIIRDGT